MKNQKYYYLQGDHIRSTIWLDREEDWQRAEARNFYHSKWLAESALAQRINIKRIFVRKEERV